MALAPRRGHLIAKNRITQYMGPASAYAAVLESIDDDVAVLIKAQPELFTFNKISDGMVEIRDFQTTGVVAFARGCPFYSMPTGRLDVGGQRVTGLFLVTLAVSIYASGSVVGIGPILIKGAVADHISRFMYGVCAVIIGMLAIGAGLRWLQAVKSPNPSLQSGTAETAVR